MFRLLLRIRLLGLWNVARHSARRHPAISIGLTLLGALLFAALFLGFSFLLSLTRTRGGAETLIHQLFYFLFLFLLAGSVPFVASTLLHSTDYLLLGAAPISPRAVVAAKLLDATVANSLQFSIIGLPAIIASGTAVGLAPAGWALMLVLVGLFVLLPALATSLLLLAGLSVFGARRVRRAIAAVNALMAAGVCLTVASQAGRIQIHQSRLSADMASAMGPWNPSAPFADALGHLGRGDYAAGLANLGALLVVAAALFAVCTLLGARMLNAATLAEETEGEQGMAVYPGEARPSRRGVLRLFPAPVAAIILKDFRYLLRDSVLLSQLAMPMILFFVPFMLAIQHAAERSFQSAIELYPFAATMTGVIVFMQTSIISLSSVGLEGRSFWAILSSPNGGKTVLWSKFVLSTAASAAAGMLLIVLSGLIFRAAALAVVIQCVMVAICAAGLCGMGVGISAMFPRFVYENPAHRVSTWALVLGFFASVGYIAVAGILFTAAWLIGMRMQNPLPVHLLAGILFVLFTFVCVLAPMSAGARRLEAYQWEY